jgi:hypothetical protein
MRLTASIVFLVIAIAFFLLAAFRVKAAVDWQELGFASVVAAWVVA